MPRKPRDKTVKKFPDGSKVVKSGDEFNAYDGSGHFLGFSPSQSEAERMAETGFHGYLPEVSELCLWTLWNGALDSGEEPLEDRFGTQFLFLPCRVVMSASPKEDGCYDVRLMDHEQLWDEHSDDQFSTLLALKRAEKPLRLE